MHHDARFFLQTQIFLENTGFPENLGVLNTGKYWDTGFQNTGILGFWILENTGILGLFSSIICSFLKSGSGQYWDTGFLFEKTVRGAVKQY